MRWTETLGTEVDSVLSTAYAERDGRVTPEDVAGNAAVKIEATFLYADLAGSAGIAAACPWDTTAKIISAYLGCAVRLIRAYGGEIRSFDGDRVMGVFVGENQQTHAVRCALEIDWCTVKLIQPKATQRFRSVRETDVKIQQACGIDCGVSRAVRAGIRNNADLIWIGKAPSFAAKLSDIREYPYCTFISSRVHAKLAVADKVQNGENIWESRTFKDETVYRAKRMRTP